MNSSWNGEHKYIVPALIIQAFTNWRSRVMVTSSPTENSAGLESGVPREPEIFTIDLRKSR